MKNQHHPKKRHQEAKILGGLFIVAFGTLFLLERSNYVHFQKWVLSWETMVIAIGIVTLYKHRFQHFFGYLLVGVGTMFILKDLYPNQIDTGLILPAIVILFGIITILKATNLIGTKKCKSKNVIFDETVDVTSESFIEATTFFGGVNKNVTSKNFQGGNFTTAFGGTEINLTKADIQHPVTINATTIFGGMTLIVPSNWQVNSEITTIFGGVEDKRFVPGDHQIDTNKTLTLKGSCVFGGVEIQSYV